MSIDAIFAVHSAEARADSAALRLATALEQDHPTADASPLEIQAGHAAVGAARAELERAEAAVHASEAAVTAPGGLLV